ncbi:MULTISPECIES: SDR family oxidoreductase [unclassified Nocardia]|uniref:SDR family oxidoreductase n=1 Tax=unclassified Nocardia TaxID=2637762 RepID=UPI0033B02724
MGIYAVTGSASGMGKAAADRLRAAGHTVIGVDIRDTDTIADLSTAQGRRDAIEQVSAAAGGRLDGAVLAAGVGPGPGRESVIPRVNYLGVVELLQAWRPALAASGNAKVVVFSSAGTTTTPLVPRRTVKAVRAGDLDKAVRSVRLLGRRAAPPVIYAATKIALSWWVREQAVGPEWAGAGIRLNAIAPGGIHTPMLERQLASPEEAKLLAAFPVPIGGFGDAAHIGDWVVFMLSDAADFLVGSVVFVDGGSDAYFRPEAWPNMVPLRGLPRYIHRIREFAR